MSTIDFSPNDVSVTSHHTAKAVAVEENDPPLKHIRPSVRSKRSSVTRNNKPSPGVAVAPRSILKSSPKYSESPMNKGDEEEEDASKGVPRPPVIRECVTEKPRRQKAQRRKPESMVSSSAAASHIEGYNVPTTTNKTDESPLVFNALSDMMAMAGTLPDPNDCTSSPAAQMVEAELNFSVFDPEEYDRTESTVKVGTPLEDLWNDDETSAESDDDDDNVLWSTLDDDDVQSEEQTPPRVFLLFWQALAQWVTPAAVAYLDHWRSGNEEEEEIDPPPPMANDVAVSRYHGVLAMLQLSMERRVVELLRRMDFSRPTPKFTRVQWEGLRDVLLDMVTATSTSRETLSLPPPSCHALGMTGEEYRYLVQSCLLSFR